MQKEYGSFIWDLRKERVNLRKHGIRFGRAVLAFKDPNKKIFIDSKHSDKEERYFCVGRVGRKIMTVRFTYRGDKVRIYGAGYWRKGRGYYEEE